MEASLGLLFAFGALFSWGVGDFFIQRTVRLIGTWKALFCITAFGGIVLFPFIYGDLQTLTGRDLSLLWLVTVITLFAALFNFEALKRGKIAIIEPIMGMELPITVGLSILIWKEEISVTQLLLIALTFIGITLAISQHHTYRHQVFERGVILAGLSAIAMALVNFTTGVASQETSPILTIWFVHTSLAVICLIFLIHQGGIHSLLMDIRSHPIPIAVQSILDNAAWLFYASAMTLIPIAIATTISESYIVLASCLGIIVNRERLTAYQWVGIVLAVGSILVLSATTATSASIAPAPSIQSGSKDILLPL